MMQQHQRRQQRRHQRHARDVERPGPAPTVAAAVVIATAAAPGRGTLPNRAVAAREAAHEREATIRALDLDGIILDGATIRRLRRVAGLSSDALAGLLGYSGALVRAWETRRRRCPARMYLSLVEAIVHTLRDTAVLGPRVRHARFGAAHYAV